MATSSNIPTPGSVVMTTGRVLELGQQLVLDRLELMRWDLTDLVGRAMRGMVLVATGGVLLIGALLMLLAALVALIDRTMALPVAVLLVGLVTGACGSVTLAIATRRAQLVDAFSSSRPRRGDIDGGGT